jgi:nitrile hydratase subunit beta
MGTAHFALAMAMVSTGEWSLDAFRFARENLPPDKYLAHLAKNYYEIHLAALERLTVEHGLVTPQEISAGRSLHSAKPLAPGSRHSRGLRRVCARTRR